MLEMQKILAKFAGTPESNAATELEEANYAAWKAEQDTMETAAWQQVALAKANGDYVKATEISAEFRQRRDEIAAKYGY